MERQRPRRPCFRYTDSIPALVSNAAPVWLGADWTGHFFDGLLEDISLHGRVLSQEEISVTCDVGSASARPFELFAAQTPPGPQNSDPSTWSGVLRYSLSGPGSSLAAEAGIDKTNLADPSGLAFRPASSELFVANRWGNDNPASIARFTYDYATHALTPNGSITGNGLWGVGQVSFNPVTGELFAANLSGGVSRFTFDTNGNAQANGTLADGSLRGVIVSLDGKRLYVTSNGNGIRQFDLVSGSELAPFTVSSGSGGLHYFQFCNGVLYVAANSDNCVYRLKLDANDNLSVKDSFPMTGPVAIAFSPDGAEMFVSGHLTSSLVQRFQYNPLADSWIETGIQNEGVSLGGILTIPDPPPVALKLTATSAAVVSWPLPADGWLLQYTSSLAGQPPPWSQIAPPYQTNSYRAWATVTPLAGAQFFRLQELQ